MILARTTLRMFCALAMILLGISSAQAITNQWSTAGAMTAAREMATATLLPSGKVLVAGGIKDSSSLASAELYDPATNSWSAAGALATARSGHTATLLPSGKVLVAGGNLFGAVASAELYDPATNSWSAAGSLATGRLNHTATLLSSGKVLVAGGSTGTLEGGVYPDAFASAELYDPATNSWSAAGSMATARAVHTATLLPSGQVLVAGGESTNFIIASAELYDPATNSWSTAGSLATARTLHTMTLLPSGKVLVAGGFTGIASASAELYDPATNNWSAAGALVTGRCGHTATLLPSGKLLVAGGDGAFFNSAELYDPATNSWSVTGSLATVRWFHTATLLPSGRVFVAAGRTSPNNAALASAELYDPAANSWSAAGSLAYARENHTTTLLPSGKVLVTGGYNHTIFPTSADLASVELYDPATNNWSPAASMATARAHHTATLLPSGKVLVVGGFDGTTILVSAELYDPTTNSWSPAGTMARQRMDHAATLLPSGKVLVTGGFWTGPAGITGSAELYDPATNSWSTAAPMTNARELHTATLLLTGKILVAGGYDGVGYLNGAELYDPTTDRWSSAGAMASIRATHTATLLPSGKVLVAGGVNNANPYFLNGVELYDPVAGSWSAVGAMANVRGSHTATLLPSGQVLAVGGFNESHPTASAELYDPATGNWSAAGYLSTARGYHTASLLPSGKVLIVGGGDGSGVFASAELFDPGLSPDVTRVPDLSTVDAFMLQTSALAATANASGTSAGSVLSTGFMPNLEGSGGATNNSASNAPVLQIQRIDNDQLLFVPNDETVNLSDTSFTGSTTAFAGFPAGPVRVRAWVNGVPSEARYSTFATTPGQPASPTASGGTLQAIVTFTAVGEDGGASIIGYTATATPGGAIASCAAPCTSIVFNSIVAGTYTFTVAANNAAGAGPASPASNSVVVVAATTTNLVSSTNPSMSGQNVIFTATVTGQSPTGTVAFNDGSTTLCSATLTGGSAACSNWLLNVGTHSITAVYSGDTNNLGSTSTVLSQLVNPTAAATTTTTTLVSAINPSTFGQNVTFTATVTGTSPTGTVSFNDGTTPICANASVSGGVATCTSSTLSVGSHSLVAVYNGDVNNAASTSTALIQTVNSGYMSLNPARLMDTRAIFTTIDGQFQGQGPLPSQGQVDLSVLGRGGVATRDVDAVVLNVTATNPSAVGFVTVWPTGSMLPNASNLNYAAGDTVANLVVVKLGTNNQVSLFSWVDTDLVVDVVGYFASGSDLTSFTPARLLDTRTGFSTIDGRDNGIGALGPGDVLRLPVAGRGGVPATGAGSVILNLTATEPTALGNLTAWSGDEAQPATSTLNFGQGQTIANLVISKLSSTGSVSFFNSAGSTHLIADVTGWFPDNAALTALTPARLLDTRVGTGFITIDGQSQGTGRLAARTDFDLSVAGRGGVPLTGAGAVVLNVTATNPSGVGFLQVWPSGSARPNASSLNYVAGQNIANLVIAKLGANGKVSLYSWLDTDAVVDVVGWLP